MMPCLYPLSVYFFIAVFPTVEITLVETTDIVS